MRHLDVFRKRLRAQGKTVVLSGDFDTAGIVVEHWLIGAAVSELELVDLSADRQTQKLLSQANPEDRLFAQQFADRGDGIVQRPRIAGAVREKHAVGLMCQYFVGGRRSGDDGD